MQIILLEDIRGTGKKGDMISVSNGYARNFLLPKKLAKIADNQAKSEMQAAKASELHKKKLELEAAQSLKSKIDGKTVNLIAKVGNNGKLFGSITSKEITEALNKKFEISLDKHKVKVREGHIKAFGRYTCDVKLHKDISASVYVMVNE